MSSPKGYKFLAKNITYLFIGSFSTKILNFLLVPLYTSVLTTREYGVYDSFNTTIGIVLPILTENIVDAVFRFTIDENNKDDAISVGIKYNVWGLLWIIVFGIINHFLGLILILDDYIGLFVLLYLGTACTQYMTAVARGLGKILDLSISGILSTITLLGLNILLLLEIKMGIHGYIIANISAMAVQTVYLVVRMQLWKHFSIHYNKTIKKDMLKYSRPMIANSISWWVNNASDKYVVIFFRGLAENGIYAIASKIPQILNALQSIFSQAWTLSAITDFDSEDRNEFFKNMYSAYNLALTLSCSLLIAIDKILANLLYSKDFFIAWKYVPFLLISILFGSLAGYIGGIFAAAKKSDVYAKSTTIGAIINTVLNFLLVPFIGAMGAALATAISFAAIWGFRLKDLRKILKLRIKLKRDICSYILLFVQSIVLIIAANYKFVLISQALLVVVIVILYKNDLSSVSKKILNTINGKRH